MTPLRAPYPYFGGKSRVASLVWEHLGDTPNYIEPFFGSGAVMLARPHDPKTETVNDANGFIANFWRAVQSAPEEVARYADWPVSEPDLHARHRWLVNVGAAHVERLKTDPEYYDAKIAGWWVWGQCQWIGSGWCSGVESAKIPHLGDAVRGLHRPTQKVPALDPGGRGAFRQTQKLPRIGGNGNCGVHRESHGLPAKRPNIGHDGYGVHRLTLSKDDGGLYAYIEVLSARLRRVRVCCGDWSRIMGPTPTFKHGMTAVFLDPPYSEQEREAVYSVETAGVAADVRRWCIENGDNPLLRIALCGYADGCGHEVLESHGWRVVAWKAAGGYGSQGEGRGRENATRERIWFSPHCLVPGRLQVRQEAFAL